MIGEKDNLQNLMTSTRQCNTPYMKNYENQLMDHIRLIGNHVRLEKHSYIKGRYIFMALIHEFTVFKNKESIDYNDETKKHMIKMDDYLIFYLSDTLNWIPSY